MRILSSLVLVAAAVAFVCPAIADEKGDKKVGPALNFKMTGIDGKDVDLSQYQGKVVMFVNVASKCGFTPQYAGLEKLHEKYGSQGLVIVGVPANEFGHQEPGTDAEISEFCTSKYGVKFVMLSKVVVKGKGITPLYKHLTEKATNPDHSGEIAWNFTKFLVNRKGEIVNRFPPKEAPTTKKVVSAIEAELKKKADWAGFGGTPPLPRRFTFRGPGPAKRKSPPPPRQSVRGPSLAPSPARAVTGCRRSPTPVPTRSTRSSPAAPVR